MGEEVKYTSYGITFKFEANQENRRCKEFTK